MSFICPFNGNAGSVGTNMGGYDQIQCSFVITVDQGTAFFKQFLVAYADVDFEISSADMKTLKEVEEVSSL